jgi:hypothetical protein
VGVTLQQEILPRVSVEVGYTRRWLQNFTVTDNLAVAATDCRSVQRCRSVRPAPAGRRAATPVSGLYNVKPDKFSVAPNQLRTYAPDYGEISQVYTGIDVNVKRADAKRPAAPGRHQHRLERVTDYCEVAGLLPDRRAASPRQAR